MRRFFIALVLLPILLPLTARGEGPSHVVAYGETLYSIARKYGVSPQSLASANGITTQSWVYAGQRLLIPGGANSSGDSAAPVGQTSPAGVYVVRAGDTLYSLARMFGITVDAIAEANNMPPNGVLYAGWQLKIPGQGQPQEQAVQKSSVSSAQSNVPAPSEKSATAAENSKQAAQSATTTYIVQPGDTLWGIAVRFGVTVQAIRLANNLATPFVFSNQRLVVPATSSGSNQASDAVAPLAASASSSEINLSIPDVPNLRQQKTLTCEEAAAAMVLRGALSEEQIVAAMPHSDNPFEGIRGNTDHPLLGGLSHYGTYAHGLQKGLAKLGHQSTAYYGQPYEKFRATILEQLRAGRPVIWWTTWRESYQRPEVVEMSNGIRVSLTPYEHTVVIVAANDKGITYHDPYDASVRFTSWANHERTSSYFNNMALVVY